MLKWIGCLIGFYFWGFWGGVLGFLLGGFIGGIRIMAAGLSGMQNPLRQAVFLETMFVTMGKLAKADGHVSQDEIDHVERVIAKLGMTADHRLQAIAWFKRGVEPEFELTETLKKFNSVCGRAHNLKQMLLVYLIVQALADGDFHPAEKALLQDIAAQLGFDENNFQHLLEQVLNQTQFGAGQANAADALAAAYKALGMTAENSDADIKRAYRKLMSQYHPDKLMGQGMPEDMIAVATEQAKEIQLAYDLIKKNRNL